MAEPRRSFWGWGHVAAAASDDELRPYLTALADHFGRPFPPEVAPRPEDLSLPPPRGAPPGPLAALVSDDPVDRAGHHYGKSYRDIVRGLRGSYPSPPDWVARPESEGDVVAILAWAEDAGIAVIPYGGGSSVVGGVETSVAGPHRAVVSLDLGRLGALLDLDLESKAAYFQAGVFGPALEDRLRPRGLTLRHYPQSFEFSTLGGWIATRSAGHHATLGTHIDDHVEALRVVTPRGIVETLRVPSSGAGPSPDRLFLGSEGALGVIVSAWIRVADRPEHRSGRAVLFPAGFIAAAGALRELAQSGLHPANCRLLDPMEAMMSGAGRGDGAVLVLGFESAAHDVAPMLDLAVELCADHGGEPMPGGGGDAAERWRTVFLRAPYLRDGLIRHGVLVETFETAVTWDRFAGFHQAVLSATAMAVAEVCGIGLVTARITHVYPDGAAPYYTVIAPAARGGEIGQWDAIKAAAAEAISTAGGTITHHHAVGRDHRRWYDRQRPAPFGQVLRAAKDILDPAGILNPGVLVDAAPPPPPPPPSGRGLPSPHGGPVDLSSL